MAVIQSMFYDCCTLQLSILVVLALKKHIILVCMYIYRYIYQMNFLIKMFRAWLSVVSVTMCAVHLDIWKHSNLCVAL